MKSIDVTGIGNGIVDIFTDISEEQFQPLGFEKGTMRLVDTTEQRSLLSTLSSGKPPMVSGGSVANSVIALAQLGGKGALCCHLADDEFGRFYRDECASLGVKVPGALAKGSATGTCVVLTTPDAERTMRTSLGANLELSHEHVDSRSIADAKWLFIEGYLLANSDGGRAAVREAIKVARETGTKVAITCSDAWIVTGFSEPLGEALKHTDLVFANEEESSALAGTKDIQAAGRVLKERFPHVVLTAGPRGAFIWWEGEEIHVPAFPCQPRDLTGAGDAFAGGFLYGVNHGVSPADAARKACFLAHNVITQIGARLHGDVKKLWASV